MISVIVPVYRGADVIADCLISVRAAAQSTELEVIAVDDGSPDRCGEIIRQEFPEVRLIASDTNRGYAYAINRGIEAARGGHLLLLNQDTVLLPGSVRILSEILDSDPSISGVAPQLIYENGRIQPSCRELPRHLDILFQHLLLSRLFSRSRLFNGWKMGWFDHKSQLIVEQPSFSAIMIRKEVFDRVGLLDESFEILFNDVDFCKRMFDEGMKLRFEPSAQVRHLLGQSTSQIPFRKIVNSHKNFVRYYFKHYRSVLYLLPNLLVAAILAVSGLLRLAWQAVRRSFT